MSDCEEIDFIQESWTLPRKKKRQKDSRTDRKRLKPKNSTTMKTDGNLQKKKKKKKNSKFKEAMEVRKAKKKEKKKKKKQVSDSFILTQLCAQGELAVKPEALNHNSSDKLKPKHLTQDSQTKTKRKKKVAFDLSPELIRIKRPKFALLSQLSPRVSVTSEFEAVRDGESCPQVTATGQGTSQTHIDSQCTSEDINSQDLFITQKTFRASPPEPSSSQTSDKTLNTTPQVFTERDKHCEGSYNCPKDSQQHQSKTINQVQKPVKVDVILTEDEEETQQNTNKGRSFQTKVQSNTNLKKRSLPAQTINSVTNPYLDKPGFVSPSLDDAKSKKHSFNLNQQSPLCLQHKHQPSVLPPITSTSTQTENFFTAKLSSYLSFCLEKRVTANLEDLKPLDLSLARRIRNTLGTSSSPGGNNGDTNMHVTFSTDIKDAESADTTTSSEDNEYPSRPSKFDMSQVRAVQMRLNESFFFKTKGEGQSPRPESPLMKLVQGREMKSRKSH